MRREFEIVQDHVARRTFVYYDDGTYAVLPGLEERFDIDQVKGSVSMENYNKYYEYNPVWTTEKDMKAMYRKWHYVDPEGGMIRQKRAFETQRILEEEQRRDEDFIVKSAPRTAIQRLDELLEKRLTRGREALAAMI